MAETQTIYRVHLIQYHQLPPQVVELCEKLRAEAGRCWTNLVHAHRQHREAGVFPTITDLYDMTKGGLYHLYAQSVQALCEKFLANVQTADTLRRQEKERDGVAHTQYPRHPKLHQTVTWKGQGVRVRNGYIELPNGKKQLDLILPLHRRYQSMVIAQVELLWRADHFELALTVKEALAVRTELPAGIAGVDLGEIHIAAVVTDQGDSLVVSGRYLRSVKRLRNKRHGSLTAKQARCKKGSRRWRRLQRRKNQASSQLIRQQRDILHKASRLVVLWLDARKVGRVAVGDIRTIGDRVALGRHSNQKISQWPHGQFTRYMREKAALCAMAVEEIDESYSSKTCSACGYRHKNAPRGRRLVCAGPGCGTVLHRDVNGAANICSRAVTGCYAQISIRSTTYQRPIVVVPRTSATQS